MQSCPIIVLPVECGYRMECEKCAYFEQSKVCRISKDRPAGFNHTDMRA